MTIFCVAVNFKFVLLLLAAIPKEAAMFNPNLILVTTKRGGHIGFIEGLLPVGKTLMDRVLVQFANAVFNHEDFLPK